MISTQDTDQLNYTGFKDLFESPGERERRGVAPLAKVLGKEENAARLLPRGALARAGLALPIREWVAAGFTESGDKVADG